MSMMIIMFIMFLDLLNIFFVKNELCYQTKLLSNCSIKYYHSVIDSKIKIIEKLATKNVVVNQVIDNEIPHPLKYQYLD